TLELCPNLWTLSLYFAFTSSLFSGPFPVHLVLLHPLPLPPFDLQFTSSCPSGSHATLTELWFPPGYLWEPALVPGKGIDLVAFSGVALLRSDFRVTECFHSSPSSTARQLHTLLSSGVCKNSQIFASSSIPVVWTSSRSGLRPDFLSPSASGYNRI
ncbi:hypothetical protein B0H10DRAFT_2355003, partial [Mycena sp. CBHHK59/15]